MIKKRAFTLLELIVMIVIMGIAFTTLPTIMSVSSRSVESVVDVQGFYHGAAKTQVVLGKPWDENNVFDFNDKRMYYVLNTAEDGVSNTLECNQNNNKNRAGQYPGLNRRMCSEKSASAIALEGAFDDIDDFNGVTDNIGNGYDVNVSVSYVPYQSSSSVVYNDATTAAPGTSNVKKIIINVSRDGNDVAEYEYYAVNIGLSKPFKKQNN